MRYLSKMPSFRVLRAVLFGVLGGWLLLEFLHSDYFVGEVPYLRGVAKSVFRYSMAHGSPPSRIEDALTEEYGFTGKMTFYGNPPQVVWLSPTEWAVALRKKGECAVKADGALLVIRDYNWEIDDRNRVLDSGYNWRQYDKEQERQKSDRSQQGGNDTS